MMCEKVEQYAQEVAQKAAKESSRESAKNMFLDGLELNKVKQYIPNLTNQELLSIQEELLKNK